MKYGHENNSKHPSTIVRDRSLAVSFNFVSYFGGILTVRKKLLRGAALVHKSVAVFLPAL